MTKLEDIIINHIEDNGFISFAEFMNLALYYPELGYYNSPKTKIGRDGDFYTSPDVNPLFGIMIAKKIAEMFQTLKSELEGQNFKIVEFGAGKGLLAYDILKYLQEAEPTILNTVSYHIIDISPSLIEVQKETILKLNLPADKVTWQQSLEDFEGPIYGCILSNELIDAFPVHRVQQTKQGLKELFVGYNQQKKEWQEHLLSLSTSKISEYLEAQKVNLLANQKAEVNLLALDWLKKASAKLAQGFILTIDYGYKAEELYTDYRFDGTLTCFHKHQLNSNPYQNIGGQDITAHVNFTALIEEGNRLGLTLNIFTTQSKFLLDMGIIESLSQWSTDPLKFHQATLAVKKLILPGGMGETFKVLIQQKQGLNHL